MEYFAGHTILHEESVDYSTTVDLNLKIPKFKENPNVICYLQVSSLILTDAILNSAGKRKKINKRISKYRS